MVTTSVTKNGFEGILFPGDGRKDKVLIVMSGSDGGMTLAVRKQSFTIKTESLHYVWVCSRQRRHLRNYPMSLSNMWRLLLNG